LSKGPHVVNVCGSREAAVAGREAFTPCNFNEKCTNRACSYLHIKKLPKYEGVSVGMLIGVGGRHLKAIEAQSGAQLHVVAGDDASPDDEQGILGVWQPGRGLSGGEVGPDKDV